MRILFFLFVLYAGMVALVYIKQRSMLFFPSHMSLRSGLVPWEAEGKIIGYSREAAKPRAIWLMMHGNAGQAADRDYVLGRMSDKDSLYVLEYPGYGLRPGKPTRDSINKAASEAYEYLRAQNPATPVCVLGESIGSGPACSLAAEKVPPDKIVLAVPFDNLASVAAGHFPFLPVRLMLLDRWDNVAALKNYTNEVDIFGGAGDVIIPIKHAKNLAAKIPNGRFTEFPGGHNDWADEPQVKIDAANRIPH
jgi:hypothetical protein